MPLHASASHIVGKENGSVGTPPAYHAVSILSIVSACELCHSNICSIMLITLQPTRLVGITTVCRYMQMRLICWTIKMGRLVHLQHIMRIGSLSSSQRVSCVTRMPLALFEILFD